MKSAKSANKETHPIPRKEDTSFYPANILMKSHFVDTSEDVTSAHIPVPFHSHDFFEVIFCINSGGVEYLIGSERYRLQWGDIIYIAPGVAHCPILPENMPEPYHRNMIRMSSDFVNRITAMNPEQQEQKWYQPFLLRTAGTRWEYLSDLFQRGVDEAHSHKPGWELAVMGNTIQLMVHLHRAVSEQTTAPLKAEKPELLDQVLEYIEAHMHEKISLTEVAHHFYVSQSTITQTFRNKLGLSFYRCVTQRRLIAAKRLIEGDRALESIAETVGFSDYSAFYRAFKQEFGVSPRQYRVNHNQNSH